MHNIHLKSFGTRHRRLNQVNYFMKSISRSNVVDQLVYVYFLRGFLRRLAGCSSSELISFLHFVLFASFSVDVLARSNMVSII